MRPIKNENYIIKIYRALFDGRATKKDFGKSLEDLLILMKSEGVIEDSSMGLVFTPKYHQKFFSYEDFMDWVDDNYFMPKSEEKNKIVQKDSIKSYNTNEEIENIIKSEIELKN